MGFADAEMMDYITVTCEVELFSGNYDYYTDSVERSYAWCATLSKLCQHPVFSTWLTSVMFAYRQRSGPENGVLTYDRHASYPGLGRAVSTLPNLHTLHATGYLCDDDTIDQMWQVLEQFCSSRATPPVRYLTLGGLTLKDYHISTLLLKLRNTLEEVKIAFTEIPQGAWTRKVFPALAKCSLNYLGIGAPEAFKGKPRMFSGTRLKFADKNMGDISAGHLTAKMSQPYALCCPFLVIEFSAGRANWPEAAKQLLEAQEVIPLRP